jgi:hypothetical protein
MKDDSGYVKKIPFDKVDEDGMLHCGKKYPVGHLRDLVKKKK